jgi:cyclopropane-fatty-acyl-phospholipid synthase
VRARGGALAIAQYTLLLALFGVASYKRAHVPLLAASLACELAAVPALARRLAAGGGGGGGGLLAAERAAFVLLRCVEGAVPWC